MKTKSYENKCNHWLKDYNLLFEAGAHKSALYYLGCISEAIRYLPTPQQEIWKRTVLDCRPSPEIIRDVLEECRQELSTMERVLSSFDRYNSDEALYYLNKRENIYIICLLFSNVYDIEVILPYEEVDRQMQKIFSRYPLSGVSSRYFHKLYIKS